MSDTGWFVVFTGVIAAAITICTVSRHWTDALRERPPAPKSPRPYPTKGGHMSGDGTINDLTLPTSLPQRRKDGDQ